MRVIFVVCLLLAVGYAELDLAFREQKEREYHDQINECSKKEGASKEDLEEIFIEKQLTRKGSKCVMACVDEKLGIQDKNGKLSLDGALGGLESFKVDADTYNKLKQIYTKCIEKEGADTGDRCETAGKFYDCYLIESKELGLKF